MSARRDNPSSASRKSTPSDWIEATVQFVNPSEEILSAFISECFDRGALGSAQFENPNGLEEGPNTEVCEACGTFVKARLYFPGSSSMEEVLTVIEATRRSLQDVLPDFAARVLRCRRVQNEDWATNWKKSFEPSRITDRIWIVPPWRIPELPSGAIRIVMEPGLAFGTGRHETTQHCLLFLEEIFAEGNDLPRAFLDVGCGSGILALAGKALGAIHVVALDKDPLAVQVARGNLALNPISGIQLVAGTPDCLRGHFDLVAANLDLPTLLDSAELLVSRLESGGRIVLAGFLWEDRGEIKTRYEHMGLQIVSEKRDQALGWTTVLFQLAG